MSTPEKNSSDDLIKPLVSSQDDDDGDLYFEEYNPPFLPALILAFPIMPLFWKYHVRVTKEKNISFGYSYAIVAKTVEQSLITAVEPIDDIRGLRDWGGWGIRMKLFGSHQIGYISKNGPGVKLTLIQDGKNCIYVFNCADPKKVCDLLSPSYKM